MIADLIPNWITVTGLVAMMLGCLLLGLLLIDWQYRTADAIEREREDLRRAALDGVFDAD